MKMHGHISPETQSPAAARPSSDGGCGAMSPGNHYSLFIVHYSLCTRFTPCAITCRAFSPRKFADNETTRVTQFANLHIGTFANYSLFTIHYSLGSSVDPMSGKYPSMSPYVYCANNPVKLVDPEGTTWQLAFELKYGMLPNDTYCGTEKNWGYGRYHNFQLAAPSEMIFLPQTIRDSPLNK